MLGMAEMKERNLNGSQRMTDLLLQNSRAPFNAVLTRVKLNSVLLQIGQAGGRK